MRPFEGALIGVPSQHDSGRIWAAASDLLQKVDPVHSWHLHIGDDRVERRFGFQHVQPLLGATSGHDFKVSAELSCERGE